MSRISDLRYTAGMVLLMLIVVVVVGDQFGFTAIPLTPARLHALLGALSSVLLAGGVNKIFSGGGITITQSEGGASDDDQ